MDNLFFLNPTANDLDIKDAINERFDKAKGVLNCLMLLVGEGGDEFNNYSAYHALWAIDGFLDEIDWLKQKLDEMMN